MPFKSKSRIRKNPFHVKENFHSNKKEYQQIKAVESNKNLKCSKCYKDGYIKKICTKVNTVSRLFDKNNLTENYLN